MARGDSQRARNRSRQWRWDDAHSHYDDFPRSSDANRNSALVAKFDELHPEMMISCIWRRGSGVT
jgi:hypothetical protein